MSAPGCRASLDSFRLGPKIRPNLRAFPSFWCIIDLFSDGKIVSRVFYASKRRIGLGVSTTLPEGSVAFPFGRAGPSESQSREQDFVVSM
jgi:hypothetical protein